MKRYILISVFTSSLALVILSCNAQKSVATETKTVAAETKNMKLGNEWVLQGFYNDEGKLIIETSKSAEITISPDEKFFTGNTGCNAMRGPVMVEGEGKIKIGPADSMRKRCPNAEVEKKLLEALDCITNYKIEGALLKLYCNEKPVVQFESYRN